MKLLMCLVILISFLHLCVGAFDYFMLSQMWPPGYCLGNRCKPSKISIFIIHGLWPQNSPPCKPSPLPVFEDRTLLKALGQKWPSITYTKDKDFWQAEWDKHGSCSLLEAEKYFQLTLDLYDRVNIKRKLREAGIKPEVFAKSFTKEQFENALKPPEPDEDCTPQLVCIQDTLAEIRFCYDKTDKHKCMNCPASTTCPQNIKFPYQYPKPPVMTHDDPMDPEEDAIPPLYDDPMDPEEDAIPPL